VLVIVFQKLDVGGSNLRSLPGELSSLGNLKELVLQCNDFPEPPLDVLRGLTAITKLDTGYQRSLGREDAPAFKVSSPLLPILHPGLAWLDLVQSRGFGIPWEWDPTSLFHLGRAMVEMSDRRPVPNLLFGIL
jgi:hypothetical protein